MMPRDEMRHDEKDLSSNININNNAPATTKDDSQLEKAWPRDSKHATHHVFNGPLQDDSTYAVFWGLRTVLARFCLWVNLPLTWIVGAAFNTHRVDVWLHAFMAWLEAFIPVPSELVMACIFVGGYVTWAFLSHTVVVFGALAHELWWNPYARSPSLKGKVGREEEEAMLLSNRQIVRRGWRVLSPRARQCTG